MGHQETHAMKHWVLALGLCLATTALPSAAQVAGAAPAGGVVNVYSARRQENIEPLFKAFTKKTGIEVKAVYAGTGLIERLQQEGDRSPADLLLTNDVGRLVEAADKGLAQPVTSAAVLDKIPPNLRDADNLWLGTAMRARVVYASKERVKQNSISYEDLADPKWKGKVCIRAGDHPYNLGLIGAMIAHKGEAGARKWLEGLKANLASKPAGDDRTQAKRVLDGECDLGIGNTFYVGLMQTNETEPEQKDWAAASRIIFPSSLDFGTHVNVSGVLMTKHAPNAANALAMIEFLVSDEAQNFFTAENFEYPVNPAIKPSKLAAAWGTFTPDKLNVSEVGKYQELARKLVAETGFND
jgi:iron(III) transport system substrate-binding protein